MSFDYLDHHFPEGFRQRWQLDMPAEPGDMREPSPCHDEPHPELDGLPSLLALRIRALGKRAPTPELRACIRELCQTQPRTRAQLADCLRRSEAHLRTVLDKMAEEHELTVDESGTYRMT